VLSGRSVGSWVSLPRLGGNIRFACGNRSLGCIPLATGDARLGALGGPAVMGEGVCETG
jgi:hypothetical protein